MMNVLHMMNRTVLLKCGLFLGQTAVGSSLQGATTLVLSRSVSPLRPNSDPGGAAVNSSSPRSFFGETICGAIRTNEIGRKISDHGTVGESSDNSQFQMVLAAPLTDSFRNVFVGEDSQESVEDGRDGRHEGVAKPRQLEPHPQAAAAGAEGADEAATLANSGSRQLTAASGTPNKPRGPNKISHVCEVSCHLTVVRRKTRS